MINMTKTMFNSRKNYVRSLIRFGRDEAHIQNIIDLSREGNEIEAADDYQQILNELKEEGVL